MSFPLVWRWCSRCCASIKRVISDVPWTNGSYRNKVVAMAFADDAATKLHMWVIRVWIHHSFVLFLHFQFNVLIILWEYFVFPLYSLLWLFPSWLDNASAAVYKLDKAYLQNRILIGLLWSQLKIISCCLGTLTPCDTFTKPNINQIDSLNEKKTYCLAKGSRIVVQCVTTFNLNGL